MAASKDPCIVVIGAGPAGLFTAHYLQHQGYRNVVVLEKRGQVGGLCLTIALDGHSFDLGANYVTPAYREVRTAARALGLKLAATRPMIAMTVPSNPGQGVGYMSMFRACRLRPDGTLVPLPAFLWALLRFGWLRWKLRTVLDQPTFEGLAAYDSGSLGASFEHWLEVHSLGAIRGAFYLPITLMGFGYLDQIPAAYALKFMRLSTFFSMVLKETPIIGCFVAWPKQFVFGFQRFFERMAWNLDVRLQANVVSVSHDQDTHKLCVTFQQSQQDMVGSDTSEYKLHADYLVLACPLNSPFVMDRCNLAPEARRLFAAIDANSYCMTTRGIELPNTGKLGGTAPLAAVFPPPPLGSHQPYGVAKQWPNSAFAQFYTRTQRVEEAHDVQPSVEIGVNNLLRQMGGSDVGPSELMNTFNRFEYFQHVSGDEIKTGWYDKLEKLQGQQRMFYVGGATNFELIEPIAAYAKNLVAKHFPVRAPVHVPVSRQCFWSWAMALLAIVLLIVGWLLLATPPRMLPYAYPLGATAAGRETSEAFWSVFQANNTKVLTPEPCEQTRGVGGNSIVCRLMAAVEAQPQDRVLPNLAASALLWRVQSGMWRENIDQDLKWAAAYADQSTANGNQFSPGFAASARWLLGVHLKDTSPRGGSQWREGEELMNQAYAQFVWNTESAPAFHGYIEGEQLSAQLQPGPGAEGARYTAGINAFYAVESACVFGNQSAIQLPPDLKLSRPMLNIVTLVMRLSGRSYCYNNAPAPFGFVGYYVVRGDQYLKAGQFDFAHTMYENAQRSPGFSQFMYKDQALDRMRYPEKYHLQFLAETDHVLCDEKRDRDKLCMLGHARDYCASCHANPP